MTVKTFLPTGSKKDTRLTTARAVVGPVCSPLTPGSRPGKGFARRRPEANPSAFVRLCRKIFPRESRRTAGPSTALRSGRDDKGDVALPESELAEREPFFITLGGLKEPA